MATKRRIAIGYACIGGSMIREATIDDFEAIIDMVSVFWCHTQFKEPFDRDQTCLMLETCLDHGLLAVADDGEVYGFIAAIKTPLLCSKAAIMATELGWWINPARRGKMAGVRLIEFLESLCIKQEVKYLNMAYMETSMPEKIRSMYEKMGYSLQESAYTKVLKWD